MQAVLGLVLILLSIGLFYLVYSGKIQDILGKAQSGLAQEKTA